MNSRPRPEGARRQLRAHLLAVLVKEEGIEMAGTREEVGPDALSTTLLPRDMMSDSLFSVISVRSVIKVLFERDRRGAGWRDEAMIKRTQESPHIRPKRDSRFSSAR